MLATLSGIVICVRLEQSQKELSCIVVRFVLFGIVIDVSDEQA